MGLNPNVSRGNSPVFFCHKPGTSWPSSEDLLFKLLILGLLSIFIFHAMRDTGEKGKKTWVFIRKASLSLSLSFFIYIYIFANLRHIQYLTYRWIKQLYAHVCSIYDAFTYIYLTFGVFLVWIIIANILREHLACGWQTVLQKWGLFWSSKTNQWVWCHRNVAQKPTVW